VSLVTYVNLGTRLAGTIRTIPRPVKKMMFFSFQNGVDL
jgi:hypothetical protein